MTTVTIATRQSALALWQSNHVAQQLRTLPPGLNVQLLPMTTRGDQWLHSPLSKIGGKGLFVKELETALLDGRADLAVHSIKDVPIDFPPGLGLPVILARQDPRDAFVSNRFASLDALPPGAVVGTASLRRAAQLYAARPDLTVRSLRGNVNTRLAKLDAGDYDAIVLASAGLQRLEFARRIRHPLTPAQSLPAIGQGALGLEIRLDNTAIAELIAPLSHDETHCCISAERAVNAQLQGGCQAPIAAFAEDQGKQRLRLRALVAEPDGSRVLRTERSGDRQAPEALGAAVAQDLLAQGAGDILERLRHTE